MRVIGFSTKQKNEEILSRVLGSAQLAGLRATASTGVPITVIGCPYRGCLHAYAGQSEADATAKLEAHYIGHLPEAS